MKIVFTKDGSVVADKQTATQGETVTLTVSADNGYELDNLTVTTIDGKRASVTTTEGDEQDTYTFEMPAAAVNVTATFKEATSTGVTSLNVDSNKSNQRYNMMGQPVGKDYKGLVIEDGHKIIVR